MAVTWKRWSGCRSNRPEDMKNTDPVLVLIAAAVITLEALLTLVVAAAALLITLAQWRPAAAPAPAAAIALAPAPIEPPLARPMPHPIAALADRLAELPVATLREMTNTRSKTIRKAQLIELIACS